MSTTLHLYSSSDLSFTSGIVKLSVINVTSCVRETEAQHPQDPAKANPKL